MKNKLSAGYILGIATLFAPQAMSATFNTNFLSGDSAKADLSRFTHEVKLPDGIYDFDVYVNSDWKGRFSLDIKNDGETIYFISDNVKQLGLKLATDDIDKLRDDHEKIALSSFANHNEYILDINKLTLNLTLPQASLQQELKGYVDPQFWDQGINGALLSYSGNYYYNHDKAQSRDDNNLYFSLNSGINLYGWQFRDQSSVTHSQYDGTQWVNNTRYVQKGLPAIKSEVRIGDSYTSSDLFDSIRMRGINLKTDMRMYPQAWQGFAPIIHGVAQTNALVKVYQNNIIIYQQTVPPGPFDIENILPTGSGGDLTVEINEANGKNSQFTVPFSAVPNMLKKGLFKYELSAGQAKIVNSHNQPNFAQLGMQYGFNNTLTGYAGSIISEDYTSYLLGSGFNLPIGAVSVDIEHSNARIEGMENKQGQSFKIAYSRYLQQTDTNFSLAAYRYSTKDYLSLSESIQYRDWQHNNDNSDNNNNPDFTHRKNTFNANINQRLSETWGSLYLSGTLRDYWGNAAKSREYQMGYSNNWQEINYSINVSRTEYSQPESKNSQESQIAFNLSVPFSLFDNTVYLSANSQFQDNQYRSSNIGLSGSAGERGHINYNFNASQQHNSSSAFNSNLTYRTYAATLSSSYGESSQFRQFGLGATGSIVAWREGLLVSNQIGETYAIIEAPGTENAFINGDKNMSTNKNGQVLIPYLSAYRKNAIILDASKITEGSAELVGNVQDIVPYSGSISYLKFKTDARQEHFFSARKIDGSPLPFGTEVVDLKDNSIGYVGQNSLIFMKTDKIPEKVKIKLNGSDSAYCLIELGDSYPTNDVLYCR